MPTIRLGAASLRLPPTCPRCCWINTHGLSKAPPRARLMKEMEEAMRRAYAGVQVAEALPGIPLPPGRLDTSRTRPLPVTSRVGEGYVTLRGELDAVVWHEDRTCSILDFKFVGAEAESTVRAERAAPQLNAYARLIARSSGYGVRALGLLLIAAGPARIGPGALAVGFDVRFAPVAISEVLLQDSLAYTAGIARMERMPAPRSGCSNCAHADPLYTAPALP